MYPQIDNNVIIIGAGISGLSAALKLHEKAPTLDFIIIESDYEIGGRLKPQIIDNDINLQLDMHSIAPLQVELVDLINKLELNLTKKKDDVNQLIIFDYNKRITKIDKHHFCNICREFNRPSLRHFLRKINKLSFERKIDPQLSKLTMSDYIQMNLKSVSDRAVISHLIWRFCGVSPTQITLEFYLFLCRSCIGIEYQITFDETVFYLQEGVQEICKRIAKILNNDQIVLNETVKKIENHARFVKITTNKSTYFCYFVIVAIPPTSLERIQFSPTVQKLDVCKNAICGKLQKFIAVYETPFWTDSKHSGEVYSFNRFPIVYCYDATTNPKYPILSGYFIRDSNSIDDNIKSLILSQLSRYFGEQALKPIKFIEIAWSSGSPLDCFRTMDDIYALQERTGRIFWAGSETSLEWYGQISGGIVAGYRAAIEVLYELRPACLDVKDMIIISQIQRQYKKRKYGSSNLNEIFPKSNKIYLYILITAGLVFMILKWRRYF